MKCSLGISNCLEEIASLSHAIIFLYFFALITEEGFLISPCYSLGSAFKWEYLSFSLFPFTFVLSSAICKASSDNHFAFLHFFFFRWFWSPPPVQCYKPLFIVFHALCLSYLMPKSICHFHHIIIKDFIYNIQMWMHLLYFRKILYFFSSSFVEKKLTNSTV